VASPERLLFLDGTLQSMSESEHEYWGFRKNLQAISGANFLSQFSSNLCRPIHRRKAHEIARVMTNPFFRFSASEKKYWEKEFSLMNVARRPRQRTKRLRKINC
jgi:hypothetical protein